MYKRRGDDRGSYDGRGRGGGGGGYNNRRQYNKRGRYEDPEQDEQGTEEIFTSLIARIGEKSKDSLESNLDVLSKHILDSVSKYKDAIMSSILGSVLQLPHKVTIYSTLVGLINVKDFDFGQLILDYVTTFLLPNAFNEHDFDRATILVRFVSDLCNANMVFPVSLISMYDSILQVLEEDISQSLKDVYVGIVMKALPWCAHELVGPQFDALLQTIEEYLNGRVFEYENLLSVWTTTNDTELKQEEFLTVLWKQLMNMKNDDWQDKSSLLRPYRSFDPDLSQALQHTLTPFTVKTTPHLVFPVIQFRFFDQNDIPTSEHKIPDIYSVDRFIMEEQVRSILTAQYVNRKECVKSLLAIPCSSRFPIDYIIIEVLMGELFRLPTPKKRAQYYMVVLLELSKLANSVFSHLVAVGFEMLFENIEYMEVECVDRFSAWMAWHLSNNDYKWSWDEWRDGKTMDELPIKKVLFMKDTLHRCVKMAYHERISRTLGEDMQPFLPIAPAPTFVFAEKENGHPAAPIATLVLESIKDKRPVERIMGVLEGLNETHLPSADAETYSEGGETVAELRAYLGYQCLLQAGSKSYSHCVSVLERYIPLLHDLGKSMDAKSQIIYSLFKFWQSNAQMITILMDKMVTYRIVDPTTVIHCLFGKELLCQHQKFGIWNILIVTLDKIIARTETVRVDLKKAQQHLAQIDVDRTGKAEDFLAKERENAQERVNKMNEFTVQVGREQKEAFFVLFQRMLLGLSQKNEMYDDLLHRLTMFLRKYRADIDSFVSVLETLVFNDEVDPEILNIFRKNKNILL